LGRKEEITENILNASIDEFLAKGIDMASMENIAKIAGVSKRTLYKYFASKEVIYEAINDGLIETFCNIKITPYDSNRPIEAQIDEIIERKVHLLTYPEYMKTSKLVLSELLKGRAIKEEHFQKFMEMEMMFISWLEAAKSDGKITKETDSRDMATQFHSLIKGQIFYPVLFGFEELTDESISVAKSSAKSFFLNSFML